MGSEWPVLAVEDVCSLIVDCVNKTAPVVPEKTPFRMIRTTNVRYGRIDLSECRYVEQETYNKWTRRAKLLYGDVVLTREAPIGEVGLVTDGEGVFLGQRLMQYRANPALLDAKFLLYSFLSPGLQHQFGSHEGSGSVVSHIRVGDCFKFKLSLPPLAVQRQVAQILGALDDRITLLRETNATLEAIAQALFKSWFVDFDPVRAKSEGRTPEGMDEATAALFPDSFEESMLGLVPKGWSPTTMAALTAQYKGNIQTGPFGSQLHASDYSDEGAPVAMPKDIINRRINTTSVARVSSEHVSRLARHQLSAGDIVFSRRGDVERHALITPREAGWLCGTGCLLVRPGEKWRWSAYLSMLLDSPMSKAWLVQHSVGATMPNLNTGILGSVPLVLPPPAVLDQFEQVAMTMEERRSENLQTMKTLATLRDTLLPRLISGQLRLPEAEALLEGAPA